MAGGNSMKRLQTPDYRLFASGFTNSRTDSMNICVTGLSDRVFKVVMPTECRAVTRNEDDLPPPSRARNAALVRIACSLINELLCPAEGTVAMSRPVSQRIDHQGKSC
jgi:hypothetical protein